MENSPIFIQKSFVHPPFNEQLNPRHPLSKLAEVISCNDFEEDYVRLYSIESKSAKPIRLMVGLSIL